MLLDDRKEHALTGIALHEDLVRKDEIVISSDREFGLVFTVVLAIIALLPLFKGLAPRPWMLVASAGFLGLTLIAPAALGPLNRSWAFIALVLNRIMNPVITGLLFYAVFAPTGIVLRLRGEDPLLLRPDPNAQSYWKRREPPGPSPKMMAHQF